MTGSNLCFRKVTPDSTSQGILVWVGVLVGWRWPSYLKTEPLFSLPLLSHKCCNVCVCACECVCVLVTHLCLTLCDPMDCSPPRSSVHGILQTRILEWVAMPPSRASSQSRDWSQVSHIAGRFFTVWATREAPMKYISSVIRLESQIYSLIHGQNGCALAACKQL